MTVGTAVDPGWL